MGLGAADIELEHREVVLARKPAPMLQASPKGTVPVLVLRDGQVLDESYDILLWSLAQRDPEGWLSAVDLELARNWVESTDGPFKTHLDRYKYSTRYDDVDTDAEWAEACRHLERGEQCLQDHAFLLGDRPSLVDVAVFPFVRQFANVEPDRFAGRLPATEVWRQRWQRDSHFTRVMRKLPPWEPGQAALSFREVSSPVGC